MKVQVIQPFTHNSITEEETDPKKETTAIEDLATADLNPKETAENMMKKDEITAEVAEVEVELEVEREVKARKEDTVTTTEIIPTVTEETTAEHMKL